MRLGLMRKRSPGTKRNSDCPKQNETGSRESEMATISSPSVTDDGGSSFFSASDTGDSAAGPNDQDDEAEGLDSFLEGAFQATKGTWRWKYWSMILALGVANSSDATEILCISYILSDGNFKEHMLNGNNGGVLAAAVFLGMLLGGLIVGTMGDWIGRRPMLLLGLFCNAIAGVLSALANNVWTLSMLRCVAGVGIGATVPPLFTLATELAPPSVRGLCVTLCASFWMVGSIYVALLALWFFEGLGISWRIFAIACALPSALGAVLVSLLVPESPRFLGLEQRSKEAVDVANLLVSRMDYHGAPLTIVSLERTFPSSAIQDLEHRQLRNNSRNGGLWGLICMGLRDFLYSTSKLYTPYVRQTTWPLQMVWFSLSFGSYGLLTWINIIFEKVHLQNVYFNALIFAASNLPGNLLTAFFMDRISRSTMLVVSVISASLSLVAFAACAHLVLPTGIVLSACLFQCFTIAAWNTIDTMTSEMFPTLVRSTGMGICAATGRIGAMVAQFVNGALVADPVKLLLVASATLMMGAFTPFFLPGDMTGQPVNDDLGGVWTDRNATLPEPPYAPLQVRSQDSCATSYSDNPTTHRQQQRLQQDETEIT